MKKLILFALCLSLAAALFAGCGGGSGSGDERHITIAGKTSSEPQIMVEVFAQLIEAKTDITVDRVMDLASRIAFESTVQGETHIYPGYSGTLLINYLNIDIEPGTTAEEIIDMARAGILEEYDLVLLPHVGFQNNFGIAIGGPFAREHNIRTLSDLIPFSSDMVFGGEHAFFDRADGFEGMVELYGLNFRDTVMMDVGLKYQSFAQGIMDAFVIYTTDSHIPSHDIVILEDDLSFFPTYYFHPVIRADTLARFPEIGEALSVLDNLLTEDDMIRFNHMVDSGQASVSAAAAQMIEEFGLLN
ncbi:MAG: hypothetical protein FWE32_03980 [Oscillospiraceae bacterium]|nr:hypothetical protein [Oscillospiraceae bacterium]